MNPLINANRSIINKVVRGYEDVEPCIMTALALQENLFVIGAHGNGKTTLTRVLGQAADPTGIGFRVFHADKAGLVQIGGLPDMERSRETGDMQFIHNQKSIFGAKVVLVDELPRADKERQNYWMEVLEDRTFQGKPTGHEMIIATGNDQTYHGNFKFDLALLSRFLFVIPAPKFAEIESQEVRAMVRLNRKGGRDVVAVASEVQDLIARMRTRMDEFWEDEDLLEQLEQFIGTFTQFVKERIHGNKELAENPEAYFSAREFSFHMIQSLIGLYAYFTEMNVSKPLEHAGRYTVKYVIEQRHAAAGEAFINICNTAWRQLAGMLTDNVSTPAGKLHWQFASALTAPQKVGFWRDHISEVEQHMDPAQMTALAGDTLQQIYRESQGQVAPFYDVMKKSQTTQHIAAEVEGLIVTETARKLMVGRAQPNAMEARVWNKYSSATSLTPGQVAEILEAGTHN